MIKFYECITQQHDPRLVILAVLICFWGVLYRSKLAVARDTAGRQHPSRLAVVRRCGRRAQASGPTQFSSPCSPTIRVSPCNTSSVLPCFSIVFAIAITGVAFGITIGLARNRSPAASFSGARHRRHALYRDGRAQPARPSSIGAQPIS